MEGKKVLRRLGRSTVLAACILTVGCGDVSGMNGNAAGGSAQGSAVMPEEGSNGPERDGKSEGAGGWGRADGLEEASDLEGADGPERADKSEGADAAKGGSVSGGTVETAGQPGSAATPNVSDKGSNKEDVIVLNEDMSVEEYLEACGMKEISSLYLNLKAVEDIVYVPIGSEAEIYRSGIYCGRIGLERFYREDWTGDPQYVQLRFRGPRARHTELDISGQAARQGLAMAYRRESELYDQPYLRDWMLENGYVLTKEELAERRLTDYLAAYGQEGSEYGWVMELSGYLVDEELLEALLEAVEVKGEKLNGNLPEGGVSLSAREETGSRPQAYRREAELLIPGNSDGVVEGNAPFAFHVRAGDSDYSVPAGTVALEEEDGWKLYAYASYYLSGIGDISLRRLELAGKSREDIVVRDMGESWQEENLAETEAGFEYTVREGSLERHYVVDSGSGMMIKVSRFVADDGESEGAAVSGTEKSTEEYLEAYGVKEYSSQYLKLKAAEDVLYVPRQKGGEDDGDSSYIDIYHSGTYCGYIGTAKLWSMGKEWKDWTTDSQSAASRFGGARTMAVEQEVPGQAASQGLAMLFRREADLYNVPSREGWMLKNGYFLTEEEASKRCLTDYLAVYGREGSGYVYAMILSDYLVDEELLGVLLEAVEIEGTPGEDVLWSENGAKERPSSVFAEEELGIGTIHPRGSRLTAFYFQAGESVYSVPIGTVAAADGDGWKLYAYVNYDLSEIGEVSLRRLSRWGAGREEIVARDMGEQYRVENLTVTETGFEYRVREGVYERVYVVDEASGMMIRAEYLAGGVRTSEKMEKAGD